jgi:CheY-like chemotaxis protein
VNQQVTILIAEDDPGHAALIERNLRRAGIQNPIQRFLDGQEVLDFFFSDSSPRCRETGAAYLTLLDIRMPKVDGIEVLAQLKTREETRKMPVIMLTTTDDPREIDRCHALGCNQYITKPIDYDRFVTALQQMGLFLLIVQVPSLR